MQKYASAECSGAQNAYVLAVNALCGGQKCVSYKGIIGTIPAIRFVFRARHYVFVKCSGAQNAYVLARKLCFTIFACSHF